MTEPRREAAPLPPPSAPRPWPLIVVGVAVVALAAGVGLGALLFGGGDDGGGGGPAPATGAQADFGAACTSLRGLPEAIDMTEDRWDVDGALMWRLQATIGGFRAAGNADAEYRELAEIAEQSFLAYQRSFDASPLEDGLAQLRAACDDAD